MNGIAGKVAVVTGGASGQGRAIAIRLAAEGAMVIVADIREMAHPDGYEADLAQTTAQIIQTQGGEGIFVPCDVSDQRQVSALFRQAKDIYGPVDILCNNAGVGKSAVPLHQKQDSDYNFVMDVCLKGVWYCCQEAIRQMLEKGQGGRIVNISSVAALRGIAGQPEYCAAKAAVAGLTRQMAVDYGPTGININAVAPGWIRTSMQRFRQLERRENAYSNDTPMRRTGTVDDIAGVVAFLVSDDAKYIQGHELVVDGGNTLVWDSYSCFETS